MYAERILRGDLASLAGLSRFGRGLAPTDAGFRFQISDFGFRIADS
jgi:hypothetical protein